MRTHRHVATGLGLILPSVVVACLLVAGCAAGGEPVPGAPSDAPVTTPASVPTTGGPSAVETGSVVLRGQMIESVEVSCRIMRADDGETYELLDLPDDLARPGTRIEVRGEVATGMMSICMQGTIFKVSSARRI